MARVTVDTLISALEKLEQALYDGEDVDPAEVLEACQNFQGAGQNFDDTGSENGPGVTPAMLATVLERLERTVSAVELTRESIRDELAAIAQGRRGLRGYRCIQPISTAQYVSRAW